MYGVFGGALINVTLHTYQKETIRRIISFASRREGWKFGQGKRPKPNVIMYALWTVGLLAGHRARETGAFLNEDGGILVTGYYADWHVEILCDSDEHFNIVVECSGNDLFDQEFTSFSKAERAIIAVIEQVRKWGMMTNSSGYFTSTTMTLSSADFKAAVFRDLMMGAYPSSVPIVQNLAVVPSVTIYDPQNQRSLVNLPSSGNLGSPIFRLAHG